MPVNPVRKIASDMQSGTILFAANPMANSGIDIVRISHHIRKLRSFLIRKIIGIARREVISETSLL